MKRKPVVMHGHSSSAGRRSASPTYVSWRAMKTRATNKKRPDAKYYGHVGLCERWQEFSNFLMDMGERPNGTSIDRIDSSKGYEPGNCRWATKSEQTRNRKTTKVSFAIAVEMVLAHQSGESFKSIANRYGCSESLPREIDRGRRWKDAKAHAEAIIQARRQP